MLSSLSLLQERIWNSLAKHFRQLFDDYGATFRKDVDVKWFVVSLSKRNYFSVTGLKITSTKICVTKVYLDSDKNSFLLASCDDVFLILSNFGTLYYLLWLARRLSITWLSRDQTWVTVERESLTHLMLITTFYGFGFNPEPGNKVGSQNAFPPELSLLFPLNP